MTDEVEDQSNDSTSRSRRPRIVVLLAALAMLLSTFGVLTVGAPAADAGSDRCTPGLHHPNLYGARHDYHYACGLYWDSDSGHHRCDWSSKGWLCSGPRDRRLQNRSTCVTWDQPKPTLDQAKARYEALCGMKWDANSGRHRCGYSGNSWGCSGPSKR